MIKYFEWISFESTPKEDGHYIHPCLLWVYDISVEIGYSFDELGYWVGGRWVNFEGKLIANHPDMEVTYWCRVPRGKNSRKP